MRERVSLQCEVRGRQVGALAALALASAALPARAAVVALYPLNEGSGQTFADTSGHGYNGILGNTNTADTHDPLWSNDGQGKSGSTGDTALNFPTYVAPSTALNDYAEVPTGGTGQPTDAQLAPNTFTFAVDINPGTPVQAIIAG